MPAYFARDTWIIVAAFNEARAIANVVGGLVAEGFPVIVVDDGSADATAVVAANRGAIVIKHPFNLGQGAAIQTGLEAALLNGAEFLVTFDADGQHRVSDVTRLITALIKHQAHFALGSRFLGSPAINLQPFRRVLLLLAAIFTRITSGLNITDAHNGLRAMTRKGAQHISLRQNRMAHASEILNQIANCGLPYVEVPVTIEYSQYSIAKGQKSHDLLMILLDLFTRRLHQ
jgi:polyprenyl-phospho-N-acetylgalactosaminyl synthase